MEILPNVRRRSRVVKSPPVNPTQRSKLVGLTRYVITRPGRNKKSVGFSGSRARADFALSRTHAYINTHVRTYYTRTQYKNNNNNEWAARNRVHLHALGAPTGRCEIHFWICRVEWLVTYTHGTTATLCVVRVYNVIIVRRRRVYIVVYIYIYI